MILLIDGDMFIYRSAFAVQKKDQLIEPVENMFNILNNSVGSLYQLFSPNYVELYISDGKTSGNNRKSLYSLYKHTRANKPKPIYFNDARHFLIANWEAKEVFEIEPDDEISIRFNELTIKFPYEDILIIHQDKDLNQIATLHYNPVTGNYYHVDALTAKFNFYRQLLMGDRADDIPGLPGIGIKRATKLLETCENEYQMYKICEQKYEEYYQTANEDHYARWMLNLTANLLYLPENRNDLTWEKPSEPHTNNNT